MEAIRFLIAFAAFHGIQIVSNGSKKHILEWLLEGRGLCKSTPWI